jgi:hypothetical protein
MRTAVHPLIETLYEGLKMQPALISGAPVCNVVVAGRGTFDIAKFYFTYQFAYC